MSAGTKTGSGFIHPNMPASIRYTAQATVTASDIAAIARKSRCETVQLPHHAMFAWRKALEQFKSSGKFADLPGDYDDQMFELPPVTPPPQQYYASTSANDDICGIEMRSDHFVTGKKSFIYYDPTGMLSSSTIVPMIVNDRDEEAGEKAKVSIAVEDMTEEERDAYKRLLQEWRATAHSKSHAGQRVRKEAGRDSLLEDHDSYRDRKKSRVEASAATASATTSRRGAAGDADGDDDDEYDAEWAALEQAERMLSAVMNR